MFDDAFHENSVSCIRYLASIVAFTSEIRQSIKRKLVWVFINENLQLHDADAKVRFGELIFDAPAEWSKLYSLLDQSVVEAETEHQFPKYFR